MTGRKFALVTILAALIGAGVGASAASEPQTRIEERVVTKEVPVTKTVEKTPASCKTALEIDNQVFTKMGAALQTFDFTDANDYLQRMQDERLANYGDCIAR